MLQVMPGGDEDLDARRTYRLLEHVNAFGGGRSRPPVNERLERLVGDYLARLLVGALTGARRPTRRVSWR